MRKFLAMERGADNDPLVADAKAIEALEQLPYCTSTTPM